MTIEMSNIPQDPELLRALTHPNITVTGPAGRHVASPLTACELSIRELHSILLQTAVALAHVHEQDVVHGDVHERNVLVTLARRAILTGFGSARWANADDPGRCRDVEALGQMIQRLSRPTVEMISVTARASNRSGTSFTESDQRRALRTLSTRLTSTDERSRPTARDAVVMLRQLMDATDSASSTSPVVEYAPSAFSTRCLTALRQVKRTALIPILLATMAAGLAVVSRALLSSDSWPRELSTSPGQSGDAVQPGASSLVPSMEPTDSSEQASRYFSIQSTPPTSIDSPCEHDCSDDTTFVNGILTANGQQYALNDADYVALGRWTCSSVQIPAVLHDDELFVFEVWPTDGDEVSARHVGTVPGAVSLGTNASGSCDLLIVETPDTTVSIDPRRP